MLCPGRHRDNMLDQRPPPLGHHRRLLMNVCCCCCSTSSLLFVLVVVASMLVLHLQVAATPLDHLQLHRGNVDLRSWIRYHECALYDTSHLARAHARVRRNASPSGGREQQLQVIRLAIKGHGRTFKLQLTPDEKSVFADDVIFESSSRGRLQYDAGRVYRGHLEDDDSASVQGIVTADGLFDGVISTHLEDYYIEPLRRYDRSASTQHSIMYKASDVRDPRSNATCASHALHLRVRRWLLEAEAKQPHNGADDGVDAASSSHTERTIVGVDGGVVHLWQHKIRRQPMSPPFDLHTPYNQPIDEEIDVLMANRTYTDASGLIFRNVNKRATVDPKKTTCMLYLQADHQFFQKYGTEEACIEVMTRHVQRVNAIYRTTDFNQDGRPDNITFMVKRIKVHTTDALRDPLYRFPGNYGVEKFLELFSEEDYDAFCLAYMFTYRDFEMGTLGLAWTGDLKNAGGVCEKNGHYRGSMKSLNTGIVTLLNYGKHVPPAVSHVTLAHEIGHNFGSPHDPESCTPGGDDGNFIMFARATSGDKRNNNHFSPCSLKSINPVLNFKARSPKGCFTEPQVSLCGNGVVEDGEECDCGWEEDCRDHCCFPQRRYPPADEPPCRLTPRSICSPSQGPCCTADCQLKFGHKCRDDNGCRDASFCNGRGPQCPPSVNKPNKTICNKEFVCFMGECTGSICLAYGLESCQCLPGKNDPKTKACELCCKLPGDNQPCISSFEWNDMPYDIPDMYSKPGTPCNDYSGYCDVFQMCREVDPSGPLATLRKLLLSEESIASFKRWLLDYWYAVLLIISTIIALLIVSTKFLGKHSDSKLKTVTIVHSQTTETVRLPPDGGDGNNVTVHPAIRSKLPLKRKVRDGKKMRKKRTKEVATAAPAAANNNNNNNNNNVHSPKKQTSPLKKKMRVSAPVGDTAAVIEIPPKVTSKSKRKKANSSKKKEVIDYSSAQDGKDGKKGLLGAETMHTPLTPDADPVGKVQNWLMKSHSSVLPKSKSTPAGLATVRSPHKRAAPAKAIRNSSDKNKSHSVGNISEKDKVRLQVVYKPPFKFSVKLRKPMAGGAAPSHGASANKANERKPRTGVLLVRTVNEAKGKTTGGGSSSVLPAVSPPPAPSRNASPPPLAANIDSNVHTVHSDLEVLLSESEFLFSDE